MKTKQKNRRDDITEEDLMEIARLIREGFTEGKFSDGDGKNVSWSLTAEAWKD